MVWSWILGCHIDRCYYVPVISSNFNGSNASIMLPIYYIPRLPRRGQEIFVRGELRLNYNLISYKPHRSGPTNALSWIPHAFQPIHPQEMANQILERVNALTSSRWVDEPSNSIAISSHGSSSLFPTASKDGLDTDLPGLSHASRQSNPSLSQGHRLSKGPSISYNGRASARK